jgi:hypothetical protein
MMKAAKVAGIALAVALVLYYFVVYVQYTNNGKKMAQGTTKGNALDRFFYGLQKAFGMHRNVPQLGRQVIVNPKPYDPWGPKQEIL